MQNGRMLSQHSTAQQDNCAFFSFIRNLNRQVRKRHALLPGGFFLSEKGHKVLDEHICCTKRNQGQVSMCPSEHTNECKA